MLLVGLPPARAAVSLAWSPPIEVATGRGERGPWQQNASRYDYVDDPAPKILANGDVAVVWVDQGRKEVLFQRYGNDGNPQLASPVNVSRNPDTFSWLPRIATDPQQPDRLYLLWQEIIFSGGSHGGDILFARSDDGGRSFTPPENLSQSTGGDGKGRINRKVWHNGSLDIIAGDDGKIFAAWTEYDGRLWFTQSQDRGEHFMAPRVIAGDDVIPTRAPSLAVLGNTVHLAWTVGENDAADIHLASSYDGGLHFDAARPVAASKSYSDAPKIALDATGLLHLVYAESEGGPFNHYRIQYTHSSDGGQTFMQPQVLSRPAPRVFDSAGFPALALGGDGIVIVSWERYSRRSGRPHGLAMAISEDGGESFNDPVAVPQSADPAGGTNGSHQGLLMKKLDADANGMLVFANSSLLENAGSRVWLLRGRIVN